MGKSQFDMIDSFINDLINRIDELSRPIISSTNPNQESLELLKQHETSIVNLYFIKTMLLNGNHPVFNNNSDIEIPGEIKNFIEFLSKNIELKQTEDLVYKFRYLEKDYYVVLIPNYDYVNTVELIEVTDSEDSKKGIAFKNLTDVYKALADLGVLPKVKKQEFNSNGFYAEVSTIGKYIQRVYIVNKDNDLDITSNYEEFLNSEKINFTKEEPLEFKIKTKGLGNVDEVVASRLLEHYSKALSAIEEFNRIKLN